MYCTAYYKQTANHAIINFRIVTPNECRCISFITVTRFVMVTFIAQGLILL